MNEHLTPVFKEIIPIFEKANIKYWVYGGVAIAGVYKAFLRFNKDVDVFVLNEDFEQTYSLIRTFCETNNGWHFRYSRLKIGRPKSDL